MAINPGRWLLPGSVAGMVQAANQQLEAALARIFSGFSHLLF